MAFQQAAVSLDDVRAWNSRVHLLPSTGVYWCAAYEVTVMWTGSTDVDSAFVHASGLHASVTHWYASLAEGYDAFAFARAHYEGDDSIIVQLALREFPPPMAMTMRIVQRERCAAASTAPPDNVLDDELLA